jgi:saccharopine dehydrogenase-like NADP-dependent oxidoreductase
MRVLIIGYGAVGSVLTKLLVKEKSIDSIFCLDIRFFEKIKNKKITFKLFNVLEKEKFISYLNKLKPDVVINASLPKFNTSILECCAKARVNYMDAASYWALDPDPSAKIPYKTEQLDYDKEFIENNMIGLMDAGVAPGLDNLLAAECASYLDEIDIFFME